MNDHRTRLTAEPSGSPCLTTFDADSSLTAIDLDLETDQFTIGVKPVGFPLGAAGTVIHGCRRFADGGRAPGGHILNGRREPC